MLKSSWYQKYRLIQKPLKSGHTRPNDQYSVNNRSQFNFLD